MNKLLPSSLRGIRVCFFMRIFFQVSVCVLSSVVCCWAQEFEVEGTTVHQIFMGGSNIFAGGAGLNPTNRFSIAVAGCKYKITVESSLANIYEAGFDRVLYHLIATRTPTNPIYNGILESHEIPADDGTTINYLWLAYASGCYFSTLSTNRIVPIWMLDDPNLRDTGFTVPAFWQLQGPAPRLPDSVTYLNDGTHHSVSVDSASVTFRYGPPFDQGFTNAEYQVLASTNIGGLAIPTQFTFTRYYVERNRLLIRTLTLGNATLARKGTTVADFRPQFTGRAITFDKRFRNAKDPVPSVRYWVTNGNWPEMGSLTNAYSISLKKYKNAKIVALSSSKQGHAKRIFVVWMLVLSTLLIPSFMILAKRKQNKTKQTKEQK